MGRKLNGLEEAQASFASPDADPQRNHPRQRSEQLLHRIAEQLGVSPEQFCDPPPEARSAAGSAWEDAVLLNRQCADLVEAFTRIEDPQDRLRCLQVVRDAAAAKSGD